jgi:hypothetical protein
MILTLSRQMGAQGEVIAARLAAAFDLRLIDRQAVYNAALATGMPESLLRQLMYEGRRSLAGEILDSLGRGSPTGSTMQSFNPLGGLIAPMMPPVSLTEDEGFQTLGLLIKDLATRGNSLILGQAAQFWLRGYAGTCHAQIVAPFEVRAARISEEQKITLDEARRKVRASDRSRADMLMRHHGLDWLDPTLYHVVINTGQVPVEVAITLLASTSQALAHRS